jgi:Carboxypeptidase regulatory-like domain
MRNLRFGLELAVLSCAITLLACSSDDDSKGGGGGGASAKVTALRGTVKSSSGGALANVKVTSGKVSATTDAAGRYELKVAAGTNRVRFSLEGYVDGLRSATLVKNAPTQLDISLLPLAPPVKLDASSGGMASGERGAAVRVPEGAFVDASGKAVSGMVDVYLSPLDPSNADELAAAPEFVTEKDGDTQLLESMGMVDIQVRQNDAKLAVASGKALELSIPVPEGVEPQPTIDLWSFDEDKGAWVNEGKATYDEGTRTYVGTAKHMSLWNADQVYTATCVCGVVEETGKGALPGARIEASGVSYFGSSSAQADSDGRFCIAVRKDSTVDIAAYHASTGGETKRVQSKSEDTLVPPRASDPRCEDAGTWHVTKDVFVSSSGEVTKCGDVENPFANSCAASLGEVFGSCYKPVGDCTIKFNGTSSRIEYSNGSYSEGTATGSSYYSSAGKLCATVSYDATSTDDIRVVYTIPGKGMYTMTVGNMGTGDFVIQCPDGKETRVTTEQQQALDACASPESMGEQAAECKIESEGLNDAGVGIPSTCDSNSECTGDDMVCCDLGSSVSFCFDKATCDLIKEQQ